MTERRTVWWCTRCGARDGAIAHPRWPKGPIRDRMCQACVKEARKERNKRYYNDNKHMLKLRRLEGKQASRSTEASDAEAR